MNKPEILFRRSLEEAVRQWRRQGLPSRNQLLESAENFKKERASLGIPGLWATAPHMLTATLDDAIGQGLDIIESFGASVGITVKRIGLLQPPEAIVSACRETPPDFLGLTVLQLDSDDALAQVGHNLPRPTRLIAGGPAFKFDPEMAERCGVHFMAADVAHFLDYLLKGTRRSMT